MIRPYRILLWAVCLCAGLTVFHLTGVPLLPQPTTWTWSYLTTPPELVLANLPFRAVLDSIVRSTLHSIASLNLDKAYTDLGIEYGNVSADAYGLSLLDTYSEFFGNKEQYNINTTLSYLSLMPRTPSFTSKHIYSTDLTGVIDDSGPFASWGKQNPDWEVKIVCEDELDGWLDEVFPEGGDGPLGIVKEMKALKGSRGIVRADIFRYLALYIFGGVYSDSDTACVLPLAQWAKTPVIHPLHPLEVALPHLLSVMPGQPAAYTDPVPSMIVSVELDAIAYPRDWRGLSYVRGIQIVQWTIKADRGHPILLDALGHALRTAKQVREAEERGETPIIPDVLNWSGPGAFSDAVYRYLLIRYGIHPTDLAGLSRPTVFGDVVVLPQHSFRADDYEGYTGGNEVVWHGFYGRWKPQDKWPEAFRLGPVDEEYYADA